MSAFSHYFKDFAIVYYVTMTLYNSKSSSRYYVCLSVLVLGSTRFAHLSSAFPWPHGLVVDISGCLFSLTKLMVSHDLPRSTVTNQIAFDQRDLHSTPEFERVLEHRCQVLVSKLET